MRLTNAAALDRIVEYVTEHPGCDLAALRSETGLDSEQTLGFIIDAHRARRIEMVKHPQRWRFYPYSTEE